MTCKGKNQMSNFLALEIDKIEKVLFLVLGMLTKEFLNSARTSL